MFYNLNLKATSTKIYKVNHKKVVPYDLYI